MGRGYDEFGNDLYDRYSDLEVTGIPNPYSRQGQYQPQNGRFKGKFLIIELSLKIC